MLLILVVAVVSMLAVVDGTAAGAGRTVTFDLVSYQTNCDRYSCQTVTDGILSTAGVGISASCPATLIDNTAVGNGQNLVLNGKGCIKKDNLGPQNGVNVALQQQ